MGIDSITHAAPCAEKLTDDRLDGSHLNGWFPGTPFYLPDSACLSARL